MSRVRKVKPKRILSFHPCFAAQRQIILGSRKLGPRSQREINRADAILLPQTCSQDLYQACKASSAELFPNYDIRFTYPGKTGQHTLFSELRLPRPDTFSWSSVEEFKKAGGGEGVSHAFPFLLKGNDSHEGEGVFLITDPDALESALGVLHTWEKTGQSGFVSQALIASGGNVLRAIVLEDEIMTYWKRPVHQESLITTVSRNAVIDKDWRKDLQERGRVQTQTFVQSTGINVAAIDYVFSMTDPEPKPLILEVNYSFGRHGLGGSLNYYRLLFGALQVWLRKQGFDPSLVRLL